MRSTNSSEADRGSGRECNAAGDFADAAGAASSHHRGGRQTAHRSLLLLVAILLCAIVALLSTLQTVAGYPAGLPAGFALQAVFTGIGLLTDFQFAFPDQMIMTFKNGTVGIAKIGANGKWFMMPYPSLDITKQLGAAVGDRGLISVAVDPNFKKNRYIYLAYVYDPTPINQLGPKQNRLSRFTMDKDALFVDPKSEKILFGACPPGSSWATTNCYYMNGTTHSIDMVRFGPDKMLWVTVGEGLVADGPDWTLPGNWPAPMDANFLGGKLLRLDPATGFGLKTNPFYDGNVMSARSKVYSVGLRNPFSGDFTLRTTPPYEMIVGDVGWFTWESIKVLRRANNVGWPCYEGGQLGPCAGVPCISNTDQPGCQAFYNGNLPTNRYPPYSAGDVLDYWNHNGQSAAAIGGTFFGAGWPAPYKDCFIYADFVIGWVKCMPYNSATGRATGAAIPIFRFGDNPIRFIKHAKTNCIYYIAACEFCSRNGAIRQFCWNKLPTLKPEPTPTVTMPIRGFTTTTLAAPTEGINPCVSPAVKPTDVPALPEGWGPIVYASNMFSLPPPVGGSMPSIGLNNKTDCYANPGLCVIGIDSSQGPSQKAFAGQPLQIGGVRFAKGFGTAVTSQIDFYLNKACTRFSAYVGVDDEPGPNDYPSEFIIRRDNPSGAAKPIIIFNSTDYRINRSMQKGDAPLYVDVNIRNATYVSLLGFSYWGNKYSRAYTHVDWADAKFYCGPTSPTLPRIYITKPDGTINWKVGQTVNFEGYATDWNSTLIPAKNYRWQLSIVHGQGSTFHLHPQVAILPSGKAGGSFVIASHSLSNMQYYYYELKMFAVDGCGRESWATTYIKVPPVARSRLGPGTLKLNSIIGERATAILRRLKRMVTSFLGMAEIEEVPEVPIFDSRAAKPKVSGDLGQSYAVFSNGGFNAIRKFIKFKDMDNVLNE